LNQSRFFELTLDAVKYFAPAIIFVEFFNIWGFVVPPSMKVPPITHLVGTCPRQVFWNDRTRSFDVLSGIGFSFV
jgi:hypothetical protein